VGGFDIVAEVRRAPAELVERYRQIAPSTLGHLIDGHALDPGIEALLPGTRVTGPAITVQTSGRDSTVCHKVMDFIEPGDVVVIASDGRAEREYSCWGEMMMLAAKVAGAAGVVIDGPLTDVQQLREIGLPVFGRGRSAITTQLLGEGGSINLPVVCGGLVVNPGDLVLGSDDGVLVLSPAEAEQLYADALDEETGDAEYRDDLLAGKRPSQLYDIDGLIEGSIHG
jgi:4-hydroxy-4-methyl-2-oxoglutarate aldolase